MCHFKKHIVSFVLLVGGTDSSSCQDPRDLSIMLMHSSVLSNQQGDRLSVYMPDGCSSRKPSPVSNSGCWCWYHKDCSLHQAMEASAEILLSQQMHYQLLLGLITPPHMLLAGIPVLRATLTLEGVWRLTAQMSLVAFYRPNCWLYTGSRSNCGMAQGLVGLRMSRDTQILACGSPKQLFTNRLNTGS